MDGQDKILQAAITAHEVNRSYCVGLGDYSQDRWSDAPQWQRDSAIAGARAIADNPATTPAESHQGWMTQKAADGWVYGETKDAEEKTHPCMVPYGDLPAPQKTKDALFGATVRGVLAS